MVHACNSLRAPHRQPARQGEHNDEVPRELGYSDTEIIDFTSRGCWYTRDTN